MIDTPLQDIAETLHNISILLALISILLGFGAGVLIAIMLRRP